jgi:hypothetical protein
MSRKNNILAGVIVSQLFILFFLTAALATQVIVGILNNQKEEKKNGTRSEREQEKG